MINLPILQMVEDIPPPQIVDISASLPRHPTRKYQMRGGVTNQYINKLVVHCTDWDTTPQVLTLDDINRHDATFPNGVPGCTYHYIIMKNGIIYKCLDEQEISWHATSFNPTSLGIAVMYRVSDNDGVDRGNKPATLLAVKSAVSLCTELVMRQELATDIIYGHREVPNTNKTCPGNWWDMNLFRSYCVGHMQQKFFKAGLYNYEVNGVFDSNTQAAYMNYLKNGTNNVFLSSP